MRSWEIKVKNLRVIVAVYHVHDFVVANFLSDLVFFCWVAGQGWCHVITRSARSLLREQREPAGRLESGGCLGELAWEHL